MLTSVSGMDILTCAGFAESPGLFYGGKNRLNHGVAHQEKNHFRAYVQAESEERRPQSGLFLKV